MAMGGILKKVTRAVACLAAVIFFSGLAAFAAAESGGVSDSLYRPAMPCTSPERSVLLDVTWAGQRLIAVGERGVVIWSDDLGETWSQAEVPTSESLTAVTFPSPTKGWAVGHGGIVIRTEDAGETWSRQLDGISAAKLAFDAASAEVQAAGPENKATQRRLSEAKFLVEEGPDKPFLDVEFVDENRGVIVGAYNLIFYTEDGGRSWQPWMDRLDNPMGLHLYAIQIVDRNFYIAGEQGLFLRSGDGGDTFKRIETPYGGSYFTLSADGAGGVILAGLRGNAYHSVNRGDTFEKVIVPSPVSLNAVTRTEEGTLFFANQAGILLESSDEGRILRPLPVPRLSPVAALVTIGSKGVLTAGWGGIVYVSFDAAGEKGDGV